MEYMQISDERAAYYARVDHYIVDHYGEKIGAYGVAVYTVLSRYANFSTKQGFPSLQTIAKKLKMSPRKVASVIKTLEENGLIKVTSGKEAGKPNVYTLTEVLPGYAPDAKVGMHTVQTPMHEVQTGMQDVHTGYAYSANKRERIKEKHEKETTTIKPEAVVTKPENKNGAVYREVENTIGSLTPWITNRIEIALEDCPPEWVIEACNQAQEAGARNWRYIQAILKNWKEHGKGAKHKNGYSKPEVTSVQEMISSIPEEYRYKPRSKAV